MEEDCHVFATPSCVKTAHCPMESLILPAKLSQRKLQTELQQEGFYFLVGVFWGVTYKQSL